MTTETTPTTLDLDALRRAVAAGDLDGFGEMLAEDVEWIEIDQRTPPASPGVARGRGAVLASLRDAAARGITTEVADAFTSGDRAALRLVCRYPSGEQVVCNGLVDVTGGRIARFSGVQAWDG
jgi:ketosteroid isomerase-like protein